MTFVKASLSAALLAVLGSAVADARAEGSGSLVAKGQTTVLKDAYAYKHADSFDKAKTVTTIVFSDKPIDAAKVSAASDREHELNSQLSAQGATSVELNIEADGNVENLNTKSSGSSFSQSGSGWYKFDLKRNDDKRIEGTFRSTDEKEKTDLKFGHYYDLKFALDIPGAASLGTPLPADGGEPGKVYRSYNAVMIKGDIDAIAKFLTHDHASQLLANRNDPQFKAMLGFMQQASIRSPKFEKGFINGDKATLTVSGKDGSGTDSESTVSMVREANAWHVDRESSSSHTH